MRTLTRIWCLSRADRRLVAYAVMWLLGARLGLRLLSLDRLHRLWCWVSRGWTLPNGDPARIESAVLAAARRVPGTGCLPRAIALQAMLRQAGMESTLTIGVVRDLRDGFTAHAWVVYESQPRRTDEDALPYIPLVSLAG